MISLRVGCRGRNREGGGGREARAHLKGDGSLCSSRFYNASCNRYAEPKTAPSLSTIKKISFHQEAARRWESRREGELSSRLVRNAHLLRCPLPTPRTSGWTTMIQKMLLSDPLFLYLLPITQNSPLTIFAFSVCSPPPVRARLPPPSLLRARPRTPKGNSARFSRMRKMSLNGIWRLS